MKKDVSVSRLLLVSLFCWVLHGLALAQLQTWDGSFTYNNKQYKYTMVGKDPANDNSTTTIPVFLIPVRLNFLSCTPSPCVLDPYTQPSYLNGNSVVASVILSPIFDSTTTYIQNGVNLGTTQFLDAFQRGNFWQILQSVGHANYHLMLAQPSIVTPEQSVDVPPADGCVDSGRYGFPLGEMSFYWLYPQLEAIVSKLQIPANSLSIFLGYDAVSSPSGACSPVDQLQGFHRATTGSPQNTYLYFGYLDPSAIPTVPTAPDVSILAHEVGEWADDPFAPPGNPACGTDFLEVGDHLLGHDKYCYTVNGFKYHLQDLNFLPYFGGPNTSVYRWSFQGETPTNGVCSLFSAGSETCP